MNWGFWFKMLTLFSLILNFKYIIMSELIKSIDYKNWITNLKLKIKQSQIKAALAVNSQLILLYWDLGKQIVEKQENAKWGSGFIDQLS